MQGPSPMRVCLRSQAAETRKELEDAMEQLHAAWDELETMSAKNFSLRSELNESKDLVGVCIDVMISPTYTPHTEKHTTHVSF